MKSSRFALFCTAQKVQFDDDTDVVTKEYRGLSAPFILSRVADFDRCFAVCEQKNLELFFIGYFDPLLRDDRNVLRKPLHGKVLPVSRDNLKEFYHMVWLCSQNDGFTLMLEKFDDKESVDNGEVSLPDSES